jgi:tetratricopeptide (TPR) repeat protein
MLAVWLLLFAQDPSAAGLKALEEQNYEAAIQLFAKAVSADPKDYYSRFHLALAYSGAAQDAKAIEQYRETLALKPGLYEAELNLGILLLQNRVAAEAAQLLESATQQKPTEPRPAFYLAEAYLTLEQWRKAEAAYRRALELDPKSAPAHYGLGRALAKQGRFADARPALEQAGTLDAQYRDSLLELAAMLEQAKRPTEAIALYREFPQVAAGQERLGALLLENNQAADAVAPLEFAVAKSPTPGNRFALVQAYIRTNQAAKALPLLEQTIAAEPKEPQLWMLRGRLQRDQRQLRDAANSFYTAAKLKPDLAEAWSEMSGALVLIDEFPLAIAALDKIRALNAETPAHYFLRAIVLDKTKQPKPALEAYKRFLEMSQGKFADQEFQARQRVRIIEKELSKR